MNNVNPVYASMMNLCLWMYVNQKKCVGIWRANIALMALKAKPTINKHVVNFTPVILTRNTRHLAIRNLAHCNVCLKMKNVIREMGWIVAAT